MNSLAITMITLAGNAPGKEIEFLGKTIQTGSSSTVKNSCDWTETRKTSFLPDV